MKLLPTLEEIEEQIEKYTTVTSNMLLALKHCRKFLEALTPVLVAIQQMASAENLPAAEFPKQALNAALAEVSATIDNADRFFDAVDLFGTLRVFPNRGNTRKVMQ